MSSTLSSKSTTFDIVSNMDLSGKTFLITGAYAGLGAASTKALLKANATVIIGGRNAKSQAQFAKELREDTDLSFSDDQLDASHTIDLGNLASVKDFANYVNANYNQIDVLMNNAGVMFTNSGKTKDGFETQFGINVVGHFLLSKMLVEKTKRQVWLSSRGHTRVGAPRIDLEAVTRVDEANYNTRLRYQQSKLGNILLAKQFRVEYPHLTSYSVHPGVVRTNLGRHLTTLNKIQFIIKHPLAIMNMKAPEVGAATQIMLATLPISDLVNGAYYADCKVTDEAESAKNMEDAKKLFDYCEQVTKAFQ